MIDCVGVWLNPKQISSPFWRWVEFLACTGNSLVLRESFHGTCYQLFTKLRHDGKHKIWGDYGLRDKNPRPCLWEAEWQKRITVVFRFYKDDASLGNCTDCKVKKTEFYLMSLKHIKKNIWSGRYTVFLWRILTTKRMLTFWILNILLNEDLKY